MNDVLFSCKAAPFSVLSVTGEERLGEPSSFDLELLAPEPVDPASLLGEPASLLFSTPFGERRVHGVVARITLIGTAQTTSARRYRLSLRSSLHLLTLRRRSRVFQHLTVPDLIQKVLRNAGFSEDQLSMHVTEDHPRREYVVQYAETDASFLRRLCEEEGLGDEPLRVGAGGRGLAGSQGEAGGGESVPVARAVCGRGDGAVLYAVSVFRCGGGEVV